MSAMKILPNPKKSRKVGFRLSEKTHRELVKAAKKHGSTPSAVIVAALDAYLAGKETAQ
jgi:predicted HicB family RNase H-like nuclease